MFWYIASAGCSSYPSPCSGFVEECVDRPGSGEYICRCQRGFSRKSSDGVCEGNDVEAPVQHNYR